MAPRSEGHVGAAIDLGSTSVHLLAARVVEHRIEPLVDESAFLGLGEAVASRGLLGAEARRALVGTLTGFAADARDAGAETITIVGTEPLRRLADAARIVADVRTATGAPLHVLSHEEEAFLMVIGVTEGRPVERALLVVDVGGGSTELAFTGSGRPAAASGLPVGAARLTGTFVTADPPLPAELTAMRAAAAEVIAAGPDFHPAEVVLVGGPASNLLKIVPTALESRRLSSADLESAFRLAGTASSEAIAAGHGLRPARARILAGGAAIIEALMVRYGVSSVRVADGGVREGTILAVAQEGPAWRDRLEGLAHGWVG